MKDRRFPRVPLVVAGALLALGVLAACGGPATSVDIDILLADQAVGRQPTATPIAEATPTTAVQVSPTPETDENCLSCHTNTELLRSLATGAGRDELTTWAEGWGGNVSPMEAWERVLIDPEMVMSGAHAFIPCTDCHGGSNVEDMAAAHEGLVRDPSAPPVSVCGDCHTNVQAAHETSLHLTLAGFSTALQARSAPENYGVLDEIQAIHCEGCQATCGQCHISQPASVGGGLLDGHNYLRRPPMEQTCAACHGSRTWDEYAGRNEGLLGDVHFVPGNMDCVDCHTGNEMHGVGRIVDSRYGGERTPKCEECHQETVGPGSPIVEHAIHAQDMSCQVCHSESYTNCSGCHVQQGEDGLPTFEVDPHFMDFRIGLNTNRTPERPWKYVLVRHAPISPTSFEFYGANLLPNFDARPTWLEATPHNIRRLAPQALSCESCHGNAELFLTADAVDPAMLQANLPVIVSEPPSLDLIEQARLLGLLGQ